MSRAVQANPPSQLCNLRFRLQQLLSHRPLPLHRLQRKRMHLRICPQQLHPNLCSSLILNPTLLPDPLPRCCLRLLLLRQLLRAAGARLLLNDPHSLVGHDGGDIAERWTPTHILPNKKSKVAGAQHAPPPPPLAQMEGHACREIKIATQTHLFQFEGALLVTCHTGADGRFAISQFFTTTFR